MDVGAVTPLRCWLNEGMPRAEAKLLAIDEGGGKRCEDEGGGVA